MAGCDGTAVMPSKSCSSLVNESALTGDIVKNVHKQQATDDSNAGQSPKVNGLTTEEVNGVHSSRAPSLLCTEGGCPVVSNGLSSHGSPNTNHTPPRGGGATVKVQVTPVSHSKYAPPPKRSPRSSPKGHTRANSAGGRPSMHMRGSSTSDSSSRWVYVQYCVDG